MNKTDLQTTMEDITSSLETSIRRMQDEFIQNVPVFDVLSDYSVGDIVDPSEYLEMITILESGAATFASQNIDPTLNYAVNVFTESGKVYSRSFNDQGEVEAVVEIIDEAGEVVSNLIDTQGELINVDAMYDSIVTSEALLSASDILVNLQKEGSLSYANFQSSLAAIPNLDLLVEVEEFDYMLEAAKAGSIRTYLDLMRQFSQNVMDGLKGNKNKIEFEQASYSPLKFVPITLSDVADFATSALSVIAAVFAPIALIPIGLFNGARMMISSVKELEQYHVQNDSTNNRLAIPLHQYVVSVSEAPNELLQAVSEHGFIKVVHVGLEQFFWMADGFLYSELFIRVEVSRNVKPVVGPELDLTWVPNNINNLTSYPSDFVPFNAVSGSSQIEISRAILTSLLIAFRLILPDGIRIHGSASGSTLFESLDMFGSPANASKDWASLLMTENGAFDEFRIIANKIPEGIEAVNQEFIFLNKDVELVGTTSDHFVFDPIAPVDNPTYIQTGQFPVYHAGMQRDETVKVGTPTTITEINHDWTIDPDRLVAGFWSYTEDAEVPPNPLGNPSSGYWVGISQNTPPDWEGAYISDANSYVIERANSGYFNYKTHHTYSTEYLNDMKSNGPKLVEKYFRNIKPSDYNIVENPNYGQNYFQFLIKYVVSGTSYWKILSFYGSQMKFWSVQQSSEQYYEINTIDVTGNLFLYKSFRDRMSLVPNPVTKSEFKVTPPRVASGSLIRTIGVAVLVTTAVIVTSLLIKRRMRANRLRKTMRRQNEYQQTVAAFNDDPTNANFAKMERASRRLNRSAKKLGTQSQHLGALARMNNQGFTNVTGSVMGSQSVLSTLSNQVFNEVVGTKDDIVTIQDSVGELKESITGQ